FLPAAIVGQAVCAPLALGPCLLRSPPAPSGPESGGTLIPESYHPDRRCPGSGYKLGSCSLLPGGAGDGQKGVETGFANVLPFVLQLGNVCNFPFQRRGRSGPGHSLSKRFLVGTLSDRRGAGIRTQAFLLPQKLKLWGFSPLGPCLCHGHCCLSPRLAGPEESAWGDEEEAVEHSYYNSVPGKEPPPGGLVDSRLALTQPCALTALGQGPSASVRDARSLPWDVGSTGAAPPGDGYVQADARGPLDLEEHLYVNTQGLDAPEPEDSPKKDLFDMRPFEDALKLHECSVAAGMTAAPSLGDQWPNPHPPGPLWPPRGLLRQEPWYHGGMSRPEAAERMPRLMGTSCVRASVTPTRGSMSSPACRRTAQAPTAGGPGGVVSWAQVGGSRA
uniref:Uncharacterized protein n=1 Tax=Papio anubis TaxID=9555 RepID=A0A8I5R9W8_PAPAN